MTTSRSPWNFCGQWHCSQVSRAGRSCSTGEGIGLEWVLKATAMTWRTPDSFDFTNHDAPGPMWHWAQPTREWGDSRKAVYSGCITSWQVVPQKAFESMCSTPLKDAMASSEHVHEAEQSNERQCPEHDRIAKV